MSKLYMEISLWKSNIHIQDASNCGFRPPPSKCRVFDFMGVPLYFGLAIWICMSLLNLRFFSNLIFWNFSMNTRVPTPFSTCRAFDFIGVSFYFGLPIWICMSFLNIRFASKLICSTHFVH